MKKENEMEVREIELDDPYITAIFAEENFHNFNNKPYKIQPFLKTQKEVAWRITGKGIMQMLEKIYSDAPVPIHSYIKALKEIRASIFLYKQLGGPK